MAFTVILVTYLYTYVTISRLGPDDVHNYIMDIQVIPNRKRFHIVNQNICTETFLLMICKNWLLQLFMTKLIYVFIMQMIYIIQNDDNIVKVLFKKPPMVCENKSVCLLYRII